MNFDELESTAEKMNIINNGRMNRQRKNGIPGIVKNNKEHIFGVTSFPKDNKSGHYSSMSMLNIMNHSNNMIGSL